MIFYNFQLIGFRVGNFLMLIILPQFPKMEKASPEQVDLAHKQYMAALAALYLKHNTDENVSLVIT